MEFLGDLPHMRKAYMIEYADDVLQMNTNYVGMSLRANIHIEMNKEKLTKMQSLNELLTIQSTEFIQVWSNCKA